MIDDSTPLDFHEKMVAMPVSRVAGNKNVYICFILGFLIQFLIVAAVPLRAENLPGTPQAMPARKEIVVRANRRTGKLVTTVIPAPASKTASQPSVSIAEMVEQASRANGVDPLLVNSVIQVESNFNPFAISPKGAQGLMQLMPATARDLGVGNSFDPRENIEAGVRYLKQMQDLYQDDRLALAAYNAGPGAVQKYKSVPPYPETQAYVKRVGERYVEARKEAGLVPTAESQPAPTANTEAPVSATEEKHPRLEHYVDEHGRLHLRTALD